MDDRGRSQPDARFPSTRQTKPTLAVVCCYLKLLITVYVFTRNQQARTQRSNAIGKGRDDVMMTA